jgi:putative MATE family efflux protein
MNKDVETKPIKSLLIKYSIPSIIAMSVSAIYNIVDRIYIGRLPNGVGAQAIAGIGVTLPLNNIFMAFNLLVALGATANISLNLGAKQLDKAYKILGNVVFLSLTFGLVLTTIGLVYLEPILQLFGARDFVLFYGKEYLSILLYGNTFNMIGYALTSTIRADGKPAISGAILVVSMLTNVILDPIFIFTLGLGVAGAAIATVISQALSLVMVLVYYLGGFSNLKLKLKSMIPDFTSIKAITALGISPFVINIGGSLVTATITNQLVRFGGDIAIGAYTIIISVALLFMMPIFGINQGLQPIVGYNYGAKLYHRSKTAFIMAGGTISLFLVIAAIIIQLFPIFFILLFNDDPQLMAVTAVGLRLQFITLPLLGLNIFGSTFFQYIGKPKISLLLSVLRQFIILFPAILIMPNIYGLSGIFLAQPVSDVISTVIIGAFVIKELSNKKYRVPTSADAITLDMAPAAKE